MRFTSTTRKQRTRSIVLFVALTISVTIAQGQQQPNPDDVPLCTDPTSTASCAENAPDPTEQDYPAASDIDPIDESDADSDIEPTEEPLEP